MRKWYTGGGAPIACRRFCEHDLGVAVARFEGAALGYRGPREAHRPRLGLVERPDRASPAPAGPSRDPRGAIARARAERAMDERPRRGRPGSGRASSPGSARASSRRPRVRSAIRWRQQPASVMFRCCCTLSSTSPERKRSTPSESRRRVMRDGRRRAGGEHCRKKPLLVRGGVRERPVDPTVHSHPLARQRSAVDACVRSSRTRSSARS